MAVHALGSRASRVDSFDPDSWLRGFAAAGGGWLIANGEPCFAFPVQPARSTFSMAEALSDDERSAVRSAILSRSSMETTDA
ncbi:hypothetical protein [Sphingobium sp. CR28]|uniref:hypothetical protein n=1 Tax=Sphingobium sp. CR28 TaxID=3400272 RepID=UPI003FEF41BD